MLRTKCIHEPPQAGDGFRVSIMSRHTLPDGVTYDPGIRQETLDGWWRELAPPDRLVGDHYRGTLSWEEFVTRFKAHLEEPGPAARLRRLVALAARTDVTILCVEPTPDHCHRRLVAEAAKALCPPLTVLLG